MSRGFAFRQKLVDVPRMIEIAADADQLPVGFPEHQGMRKLIMFHAAQLILPRTILTEFGHHDRLPKLSSHLQLSLLQQKPFEAFR